jgi:AAA15 family ATPase/GTPase
MDKEELRKMMRNRRGSLDSLTSNNHFQNNPLPTAVTMPKEKPNVAKIAAAMKSVKNTAKQLAKIQQDLQKSLIPRFPWSYSQVRIAPFILISNFFKL